MRIFTLIIVLIILLLGISFAVLNANSVTINYYTGIAHLPLSLLLVIVLVIGVFIGLLTTIIMFFKAKAIQSHLRKQLHTTQKELDHLRKQSLEAQ